MVKRRTCLYKGQLIGVEKIYTIQEGKQIYISGKVEELHKKGRNRELFCPCGCGANVSLVAGPKMLRGAHFRSLSGYQISACSAIEESDYSILSKIILKSWFETNRGYEVACRVPLTLTSKDDRKYEFTFFDFQTKTGLCYWLSSSNITDDKLLALSQDAFSIHTIHIVDIKNATTNGQYQESMMKIQNRQGFNLFFTPSADNSIFSSLLDVRAYVINQHNIWEEVCILSDFISNYDINEQGDLIYNHLSVKQIVSEIVNKYEYEKQEKLQKEKRDAEQKRLLEIKEESERAEKLRIQEQLEKSRVEKYKMPRKTYFMNGTDILNLNFDIKDSIRDQNGRKWLECKKCERRATAKEFHPATVVSNYGYCHECIELYGFPHKLLPKSMKAKYE